jgi:hypothetical protein
VTGVYIVVALMEVQSAEQNDPMYVTTTPPKTSGG